MWASCNRLQDFAKRSPCPEYNYAGGPWLGALCTLSRKGTTFLSSGNVGGN